MRSMLLATTLAFAASAGQPALANAPRQPAEASDLIMLEVVGTGSVKSPADAVVIRAFVKNEQVRKLASELAKFGVRAEDIKTSNGLNFLGNAPLPLAETRSVDLLTLSVGEQPAAPDQDNATIAHITLRDVSKLKEVQGAIKRLDSGAFMLPAAPQLNDPEPARQQALEAAIDDARKRAAQLASLLHARIHRLSSVSSACGHAQQENLLANIGMAATDAAGGGLDARQVTTSVSVCASFQAEAGVSP